MLRRAAVAAHATAACDRRCANAIVGLVRRVNERVLGLASIQLNTFPSGHAAASLATALAVGARLPLAGLPLGLLAIAIAIASVVGRYHYAADALTGAALALLGFVISQAV